MASRQAIRLTQFATALNRAWTNPRGCTNLDRRRREEERVKIPWRIGLAVSGGADSMALAHLSRELERSTTSGAISITAFVVDHRARQESSEEAKRVAGWLTDMGIETKVLELDWSPFSANKDPLAHDGAITLPTAFETVARRLRFQAIGKACREKGIKTLLMGHHSDDSVETTIWRLSAGARGAGLAGIPETAGIPECHGIFGVSESGVSTQVPREVAGYSSRVHVRVVETNTGTISFSSRPDRSLFTPALWKFYTRSPTLIADGGVLVCRPFLAFPKSRLVATCEENNVPYVNDPTNYDPTLTSRNTIRSLLASNSLPRALQPPSMVSLIESSQALLDRSHELSNELLSHCRLVEINLRTGHMVVEFPTDLPYQSPALASLPEPQMRDVECLALRHITELVSPCEKNFYPLRNFTAFTSRVFPRQNAQADSPDGASHENSKQRRPFTVGSVFFNPLTDASTGSTRREGNTWLLYRQPFHEIEPLRIDVPIVEDQPGEPISVLTDWTLWDSRYWFRFFIFPKPGSKPNVDKLTFFIKPLQIPDLHKLSKNETALKGKDDEELTGGPAKRTKFKIGKYSLLTRNLLKAMAPGKSRYTIPLLMLCQAGEPGEPGEPGETDETNNAHLLALPTLGWRLCGYSLRDKDFHKYKPNFNSMEIFYAGSWWIVEWEWMYKMIDTDALQLMSLSPEADDEAMVHPQ